MTYLTRDAIFAAPDLPTEDVEVPEWGGTVRLRGLSGTARDEYEKAKFEGNPNLRAKFMSLCIIDDHGTPVFTDVDVARLGQKSSAAFERLLPVALRLSGMSADDKPGETEAGKDSEDDPSESPGSTSQPD
jgi:hypothetical protein